MNDSVLTVHTNRDTCGIAKFNHALASRLKVPCLRLGSAPSMRVLEPLISTSVAEVQYQNITRDKKLRAPVFLRLRHDKELKECIFPDEI